MAQTKKYLQEKFDIFIVICYTYGDRCIIIYHYIEDFITYNGGIKMKIKKSVSRFFGVVLATLMVICTPLSAFAAEINTPSVENSNFESSISEEGLARQSSIVSGTIGANGGTINIYPYLEQGSIFGRTICIRTSSSSSTGAIFLYLYDKNGKLVSNDWIMGVNDSLNKYMGWADYGTYTLKIVAQVNQQPVTIDAWWQ